MLGFLIAKFHLYNIFYWSLKKILVLLLITMKMCISISLRASITPILAQELLM